MFPKFNEQTIKIRSNPGQSEAKKFNGQTDPFAEQLPKILAKPEYRINFLEMNKQVPNAFNSISTSSVDWKARNEQAQKIREMQVIYKIKKTLAQSVKWNVVRKKRQELEAKYI